jgi:hypothetical protein
MPSDMLDDDIDHIEGHGHQNRSQMSIQHHRKGGMMFGSPNKNKNINNAGSELGESIDYVGGGRDSYPFQKKHTYFRGENDEAMDIDGSDDDSDEFEDYEVNMDTGDNKKKKYKRMYDSKYKIPAAKRSMAEFSKSVTIRTAALQ